MTVLPQSALLFMATMRGLSREEALANVDLEYRMGTWSLDVARAVRLEVLRGPE